MKNKAKITGGIYLVIDPSMDRSLLLSKLALALKGGLAAVQIWNNWLPATDKRSLVADVSQLCQGYGVSLLIDEHWELLAEFPEIDGVHFDAVPANYTEIQHKVARPFLSGITCSGDLATIQWADQHRLDYISFCAMFPSSSAGSCPIVMPSMVKHAYEITDIPIFVSGGITPENICTLQKLTPFHGVAVISGIMGNDDPYFKVQQYQDALKALKH